MASSSMNAPSAQAVLALVRRLNDADPDFRFMSLNDLLQLLTKSKSDFLRNDYNLSARTLDNIIKSLDDKNSEVQNLAVQCLGPLARQVPTAILPPMIDKLSLLKVANSVDNTIPSMALRSVITALPSPVPGHPVTTEVRQAYEVIQRVLIPRLVGPIDGQDTKSMGRHIIPQAPKGLLQDRDNVSTGVIDILIELVRCFGPLLELAELDAALRAVMQLLESEEATPMIKKRAVVSISMLALYLSNEQLNNVIQRLTSNLAGSTINSITRRLYISILGSMARSIPSRFGSHLLKTAPVVLRALSEQELQQHMDKVNDGDDTTPDFNEVREAALMSLETFLASCPREMLPYADEIIAVSLRYMKYDPNYAIADDDMDLDECAEDADDDMDLDECAEDADDDEYEEDDGFEDDDDDTSWKVRRCAVKVLYTLIATRGSGDLLDNSVLYAQAAPALIKRMDEKEENVRMEVVSALSLLIRKTSTGLHLTGVSDRDPESEAVSHMPMPPNRKRRRQSSGGITNASRFAAGPGLTSPVMEKVPFTGPQADLARLVPSIIKSGLKQLKGKSILTKQSIINMLNDLALVQRGGLSNCLTEIIDPVTEEARASTSGITSSSLAAAGGHTSATPSTLRIAALRLISDICKTHSSSLLQPYLTKIVTAVTLAVQDKFYKISSEAIQTAEELIKTMTPPRSRNAGSKYSEELNKLYDVILLRGQAHDADAEVRQRAIQATGVLLSRIFNPEGTVLLPMAKRGVALDLLRTRLKSETTRLAAVRAIDNVTAFATSPGQLERGWIQEVALDLCAQLRKANRTLRASSVMALKQLILCGATQDQLEPSTIEGIVSSLMPILTDNDMHLLGPALLILANIVQGHPDLVITLDVVAGLCQLLRSHFAGIVLEQLLELTSKMGQSGATGQLMRGLLADVSISGDPSVVGKVMGTLLVTGGDFTGYSLESFSAELKSSAKSHDDARVSLALAVLGEAGLRLGAESPLKPEIFLEQFHPEPDKVSLAAAVALGRAGSGNVTQYLPFILEKIKKGGNTQYLLIQSIKEILHCVSMQSADLGAFTVPVWGELLSASENADNRVVCAECVGRLAMFDPGVFMPRLETLLKATSSGIRSMAVQAVRYTLPESDETFDAVLKQNLIGMLLVMLQDSDMEIRRFAMSTLNSAAHNKPALILPRLVELVPFVLTESKIKPELIKDVMLGPFKHTVDDGLEVRKSAYETLYALIETAFDRIDKTDLYDRVVAGLKDDNDIRQLCNLMVTKLVMMDPDETARRLEAIAEAYRGVLSTKLKENAVKQDIEKQEEANKSILRVTLLLGDKMKDMMGNAGAATANVGAAGAWTLYWEWVNKEFDQQLKGLLEEKRELQTKMA